MRRHMIRIIAATAVIASFIAVPAAAGEDRAAGGITADHTQIATGFGDVLHSDGTVTKENEKDTVKKATDDHITTAWGDVLYKDGTVLKTDPDANTVEEDDQIVTPWGDVLNK